MVIRLSIPLTQYLFRRYPARLTLPLPPNSTLRRSHLRARTRREELQVTELYEPRTQGTRSFPPYPIWRIFSLHGVGVMMLRRKVNRGA